ncbi:unnamed protein product [Mytilus coruscus]|uniref:C2H2-type domain-containing protein n=1 Tax=Mytilus coruscus TaxID=42192 RepID=A0A6J8DSL5_MYTCO|nr:unnamed protein product [Mytilus coruscus]
MNGNSRNQNDCDVENVFGLKKKTYWKMYEVKRFQYRGKRKFTPLLYQSLDGGMVISNDVFGLTIFLHVRYLFSRSGWSRHVRFFHTKHELGCGQCTKTFSSKDYLRRHERTVHQAGPPINVPSPTPVDTTAPALSPTPGAVQVDVIGFEDMMVIDNKLDLLEIEPIRV